MAKDPLGAIAGWALALGLLFPAPASASVLAADLQLYSICTPLECGDVQFDPGLFAAVWDQADIRMNVLPPKTTEVLDIATTPHGWLDPVDALAAFRGSIATRPETIFLGFASVLEGAYGLGYRNTPQTLLFPFAIVESRLDAQVATLVAAHEIGHVLGAAHISNDARDNLMTPSLSQRVFSDGRFIPPMLDETRAAVRASPLLAPVPAAPSILLAGTALGLLAALGISTDAKRPATGGQADAQDIAAIANGQRTTDGAVSGRS